jgi:DNA-binding LacI/PurR family transcriptional regulator
MSVLDSADTPFALTLLWPLLGVAETAGFHVVTFAGPQNSLSRFDELMNSGSVDAFVLTESTIADPRAIFLAERRFPFVSYGRLEAHLPQCWVDMDNDAATRLLVDHFAAREAKTIAFIAPPTKAYWHQERRQAYQRWMKQHGHSRSTVLTIQTTPERISANINRVLARPGPHAFIVSPHRLASAIAADIRRRGLSVGGDIGIGAYDAPPMPWMSDPAIVTASVPADRAAAALLSRCLLEINAGPNNKSGLYLTPRLN